LTNSLEFGNIPNKNGILFKIDNLTYYIKPLLIYKKIVYKMESLIETNCKDDIFCLIHQIKEINDDYLINPIYVYKSCGEYVVILEKLSDTITNENRNNIPNEQCRQFAKYRGNKFLVKDIFHKFNSTKKISSILSSNFENTLEYEIGKVIIPDNFDTNLEKVCSNGIHYFLKLECAYYYSLQKTLNGEYLEWYENGQQYKKCIYTDDKINGEYLEWYENGQQYKKCIYTDDKINGEYLEWYKNGQQHIKCTYTNGKRNGECLEWHENGQQHIKCTYTNGKRNGEYLEWYENGQQYKKCIYTDDKINGEYLEWYENGQQLIKCTYTDGEYLEW
jgi:antitoxin component YwqK of YwqJK toxin-antitoxin module